MKKQFYNCAAEGRGVALGTAGRIVLAALVLAFALASCTSSKIKNTWKDPGYEGKPGKMLVHILARNPSVRIMFENYMVDRLARRGVAAMPAHGTLPDDLVIDREALKRVVKEHGIDTVFIGRTSSRKDVMTLRPGQGGYMAGAYADSDDDFYVVVVGPSYMPGTYSEETVTVEMGVFDVRTRKRVWSAMNEVYIWNVPASEVKPEVERIIAALIKDKIIP